MIRVEYKKNPDIEMPGEFERLLSLFPDREYFFATQNRRFGNADKVEWVVGSNFEDGTPSVVFFDGEFFTRNPWTGEDQPSYFLEAEAILDGLRNMYDLNPVEIDRLTSLALAYGDAATELDDLYGSHDMEDQWTQEEIQKEMDLQDALGEASDNLTEFVRSLREREF